jgi:hypothetical protein
MARKRTTSEGNGTGQAATPKNNTEAVKLAIAGGLTSPTEIVAHVKERYGLDVTPNHVSMIKGNLKKRKKKGKPGRKPREAAPVSVPPAAPSRGLTPEDLTALAVLAEKAGGVDQLQEFLSALKKIR